MYRGHGMSMFLTLILVAGGCSPSESQKKAVPSAQNATASAAKPTVDKDKPVDKAKTADKEKPTSEKDKNTAQPAESSVEAPKNAAESKPEGHSDDVHPAESTPVAPTAFHGVPLGLPPVPTPSDNPMTPEKIELGKMLYFDKRLSKDGTISCATCHDPKKAWAEHSLTSTGIAGQLGARNSPTVLNAAYAAVQFWDGRAASLEEQALGPIENPVEMGHQLDVMVQDLSKIDDYKQRFQAVFGTDVTKEGIAKAIAAFERTILSGNSPYDRFKAGDAAALNDAQKHGLQLFEENCATCHTPPLMSNYRFYNAGVGFDKEKPDQGRMDATKKERDLGKFRVPSLREVASTAPYFHDGSAATLEEAVALMADGGRDNPNLSAQLKSVREAKLTDQDRKDLVELLKAFSGEYPIVEPPQ
jgi:cytochrome c peroxidase